jgi:Peptidase family M28/Repeat of unknown function (DUF346)
MFTYVVAPSAPDRAARGRAVGDSLVYWCRFGDQTVYWEPTSTPGASSWLRRLSAMVQPAQGALCLVAQVGNAFLDEFPDARVIVNKGRYLAVDLTPDQWARARRHSEHACFACIPLPQDTTVFGTRTRSSRQPDPAIASLVAQVSSDHLRSSLATLVGLRTRHSLSAEYVSAADWCHARLQAFGFAVAKTAITVGTGSSYNIVADKQGRGSGRKLVLVTAHLDSINLAGSAGAAAPGADDNASGVAGALEIARIAASHLAEHDLRVILFGGEEQGLHGSRQHVNSLQPAERARIDAVINMDMIGTVNTADLTVLLEGAEVSQGLMNELADAAHTFTSLRVQTSLNPFNSDHVPFIEASLPALLTIEGADSTNHAVHTGNDTLDRINVALARQIVQTNLAVVARRLGLMASATRPSSSPVAAWGANRLDVFVLGTDRAMYHKWWDGAAWGPSVTGYEYMGGTCESMPQVVAWGSNRLDVFVTGTDSALYHKWWDGSAWGPSTTGYEYMGGVCIGEPRIVSWGSDRLDVFVLGTDRALYHKWWDGSAWGPSLTDFEYMGGTCLGQPEIVAWGPNRLDVFVIGTDRALYHKWWDGSTWGPSLTGYERLGGVCASSPRVLAWGPNRLDVFVTGTDGALYHKWWDGSAWGPSIDGFERLGGVCVGEPEVVAWGPNRLDVFVIGTDSALHHKWWDGSAWGPSLDGFEYMGGVCTSQPRAVAWAANRLDVFVTGTDSALYHKWWDGSAWGPSLTGYEPMGGTITAFRSQPTPPRPAAAPAMRRAEPRHQHAGGMMIA